MTLTISRPAAAADPMALYEGDGVTLTVHTDDPDTGQQTGTITFKGNTYPFTAVTNAGGGAAGSFEAEGHRYSFNTLPRDRGRLLFATGSRRYTLEPIELPPPAVRPHGPGGGGPPDDPDARGGGRPGVPAAQAGGGALCRGRPRPRPTD